MKSRNISLDLLRIIAMFFVLISHSYGSTEVVLLLQPSDWNYYFVVPIYFVSSIGNTLFFMITGYFASKRFKAKKVLFLERKTAFYSLVILAVTFLLGLIPKVTIVDVIKAVLPIFFNANWFVSVYIVLIILSVPLCIGLDKCSSKAVLAIIIVLFINNTCISDATMTLMQGLLAFLVGYYVYRVKLFFSWKQSSLLAGYFVFLLFFIGERYFIPKVGLNHTLLDTCLRMFLIITMSVFCFLYFSKLHLTCKWPSIISGNILAVNLITVFLFQYDVFGFRDSCIETWFVPYSILINILLFLVCVLIDRLVTRINNVEVTFWINLYSLLRNKVKTIRSR